MRKVNLQVIRPWITQKVIELVGFEDEVVVEYAMGLLEDESQPVRPLSRDSSIVHIHQYSPLMIDSRSPQNANKPHRFPY
jgi:hypothetical protein